MKSEAEAPESPNRGWTQRWVELRHHDEQWKLWNSGARFKIVPAGRRSGKTELAKRRVVEHLFRRTWHGQPGRYFAAAPTRDQAKRIFWKDLKKLTPRDWIASISESDLCITTKWGAELWVLGLDKPERIEGDPWDGGVVDELANCKPGMFDAHIRPALADRRGWLWLIGVPDMDSPSQVEYANMYQMARDGEDPEWEAFIWPSADILPAEEVESAKRRMDARMFEQEFLGVFLQAGGLAFPEFSNANVSTAAEYDPALPLCWSLDFNVNPLCAGIIQHYKGEVRVIDEIEIPDTVTPRAITAFVGRAAQRQWKTDNLIVYGDASGNARHTTADQPGITDWILVRNGLAQAGLKYRMKVPNRNPPIPDTRNALNARIKSADGIMRLIVNPRCKRLIGDIRSALWPAQDDWKDLHCLAWLRYFVAWEYPVRSTVVGQPAQYAVMSHVNG